MIAPDSELIAILHEMNPWWRGERVADLPTWRRAAFAELDLWLRQPPAPRAVLLSGARQIGKTTLFLQAIEALVAGGVPPRNVLYVTFDHPLLKLAGLDTVLTQVSCDRPRRGIKSGGCLRRHYKIVRIWRRI